MLEQALQLQRERLTPYYAPPPLSVALREVHSASAYACMQLRTSRYLPAIIHRADAIRHFGRGGTAISLNVRRTVTKKWNNRKVSLPTAVYPRICLKYP